MKIRRGGAVETLVFEAADEIKRLIDQPMKENRASEIAALLSIVAMVPSLEYEEEKDL